MSNVKSFSFNKSYEEIEIEGKNYKIEFNDEKLLEYSKAFDNFYLDTKRIDEVDTDKLELDEQDELFKEMKELIEKLIDILLGKNAFQEIYEASGESTMNMINVVEFLSDVVGEKLEKVQGDRKKKYLKKKIK